MPTAAPAAAPAAAIVAADFATLAEELGHTAVLFGDAVPERNANDNSAQAPQWPITVLRPVDAPDLRWSARDGLLAYAQ